MSKLLNISIALLLLAGRTAFADWDFGQPAKWVQMPDLAPTGIDVNAYLDVEDAGGNPQIIILADDFECTSTGPISDIHIWGSWKHDVLPLRFDPTDPAFFVPDPGQVQFRLSIHEDIPALIDPDTGEVLEHSRPGPLLWDMMFDPGQFTAREWATDLQEGWLDPLSGNYEPFGDTICYQYNFLIDEAAAYLQQGTPDEPVVYWLDVWANPQNQGTPPEEPIFGWKTSRDHWNDDAVYGPTDPLNFPTPLYWQEMLYPIGHPNELTSMDMAFVITPEPATLSVLALGAIAALLRRRR